MAFADLSLLELIPAVRPGWGSPYHLREWCAEIEGALKGGARSMCSVPFQHYKSSTTLVGVLWLLLRRPTLSIIVMTHSHPLDFDITVAALRRRTFDFVGLIGSETKRARFVSFARQMGVAQRDIERLVCPIGMTEIKGKEPAVIAAALAAQLLMVSEQVSVTQPSPAIQPA